MDLRDKMAATRLVELKLHDAKPATADEDAKARLASRPEREK